MSINDKKNSRFDEWESVEVDCNTCDNYWTNSCDGVPLDKKRNCQSYIASRSISIPEELEEVKQQLQMLEYVVYLIILSLFIGVMIL